MREDAPTVQESKRLVYDPPMDIDPSKNPRCQKCQSLEVDRDYSHYFDVHVCKRCIRSNEEEYALSRLRTIVPLNLLLLISPCRGLICSW